MTEEIRVDVVANWLKDPSSVSEGWRKDYGRIQDMIQQEGEESWTENSSFLEPPKYRCADLFIPVSSFIKLQRLYAYLLLNPEDKSNGDLNVDVDPSVLDEAIEDFPESHLLCHASEGYYIPLDFKGRALFDAELPGGWVGSTARLLEELVEMVIPLNVTLLPLNGAVRRGGGIDISSQSIEELNSTQDHTFDKERKAWFRLYEVARYSHQTGSSIILKAPG